MTEVVTPVTVEPGDTLWEIATEEYGDATLWPRIYRANDDQIEHRHSPFTGGKEQRHSKPSGP